jgi:hypothetical protein
MFNESQTKISFITNNINEFGRYFGLCKLEQHVSNLQNLDALIRGEIENKINTVDFFTTKQWDSVLSISGLYRTLLYALVAATKPRVVVETGVLHGLTSLFMLQAIKDNDFGGELISIDLPSTFEGGPANKDGYFDTLPPDKSPGWLIPERLEKNWILKLGASVDVLPSLFNSQREIELFVHDSEHTHETMSFEFHSAWEVLLTGGFLVADNIEANTSFFDFCRKVDRVPYVLPADPDHVGLQEAGIRVGVIRK